MRKRIQGRTLSRNVTQRKALLRTMLVSLVKFGSIKTTLAKAKELKPFAERMTTRAKKVNVGESNSRMIALRQLKKDLPEETAKELIEVAKKHQERKGGYLRIVKLPTRKSDTAEMAILQWVEELKEIDRKKEMTEKKEVENEKKDKTKAKKTEKKATTKK
jgi:large subunit ribosomal protein L17